MRAASPWAHGPWLTLCSGRRPLTPIVADAVRERAKRCRLECTKAEGIRAAASPDPGSSSFYIAPPRSPSFRANLVPGTAASCPVMKNLAGRSQRQTRRSTLRPLRLRDHFRVLLDSRHHATDLPPAPIEAPTLKKPSGSNGRCKYKTISWAASSQKKNKS